MSLDRALLAELADWSGALHDQLALPAFLAQDLRAVLADLGACGLRPGLPAQDPLVLTWEREGRRVALELHGWRPGGGSCPGLPAGEGAARRRRLERVRVYDPGPLAQRAPPAPAGLTLDLRRLAARHARTEPP